MVLNPTESDSFDTQIQDNLASPQEARHCCQFCSMSFLTFQGLVCHKQETHLAELILLTTKDSPPLLNLEEPVHPLGCDLIRAQRHVLRTSRDMAPADGSSSSCNVDLNLSPHAFGFGEGDETLTEVLHSSHNCNHLFGLCLNNLVKENYFKYPPPGFVPLVGESSTGVRSYAQEIEDENKGEVQGDGDEDKKENEKPIHEALDLNLKL